MKKKIPDKCKILASLLDDIAINHETIIIEDKGCIITHDGIICDWFIESLRMMKEKNRTVLGIASKFRIRVPIRDEEIFIVNVPPLNKMECGGLLQKYLLLEEITLSKEAWEKYELHHRSRMSIKPGITGMWQASGRSDITDFEEVVKLDTEYIENWSIGLDSRILLKTVRSVVKSEGSV